MQNLINLLSKKTNLQKEYVSNILKLLEEGSTIPFIARYRKEMTGGADDEVLREFETIYNGVKNLLERKAEISRLISERAVLSDELQKSIEDAQSLRELEDIYRPYKEKKNSRAATAIANGLTPLANTLQKAKLTTEALKVEAKKFINAKVKNVDEALQGAQDILAERYAENPKEREYIRNTMLRHGVLEVKKTKTLDENGVYKNFVGSSEKIAYIPSHRYLAIMRGVNEKELSAKIGIDIERIEENIRHYKIPKYASSSKEYLEKAYTDGLKRLLLPSIEREVHSELKEKADLAAIGVFGKNLGQLLMTPPVSKKVLLGVDPAYRTGCKLAVIDENGNYLESAVIYPTEPQNDYEASKHKVLELHKKYTIDGVAIGNGTASRETQEFFAKLNAQEGVKLIYTVVSEAGASVYSASKIAAQEYPDLDVTIRGAISIAQRLRDPMAALVKIDPKSLGIGQYQHDVNQKLLEKKLGDVTEDLVNRVGVDINSASLSLLSHIAGITPKLAQNIISYRDENGNFTSKEQLLNVKGLGKKAYEQAAGFIRIKDGKTVFDNSGIHPESYGVAKRLEGIDLKTADVTMLSKELGVGEDTLKDIIKELLKPGFDPREELPAIPFKEGLRDIKMLKVGSFVSGVVRNIADFGAFVDIGLKNDGMIHISKMSEKRIKHPLEVLSLNQYLPKIEVVSVDNEKGKIGLSLV
ncbi:helix-hairpin-helix domain-containing protein [Sulfurimonas microaerophilic]|uniref:helix-hairpin-helix domain-containing protein n=1 Tax=Sulfurimonas microaerophilic TaxID=3058392 RepID=UPI002714619B|nr:Tex family protein [Sulfurimonas sp. hsl 1-7]